jgi:RecA-family ATPase
MSENVIAIEEMATALGRPDLIWAPEENEVEVNTLPPAPSAGPPVPPLCGYPEIISLQDWTEPEPMPEELIEGVLHREMKLMLGGGSKCYKTWVLMALAIAVAAGQEWLGFRCRPGKVIYLNFELHQAPCQSRLRRIARSMELQFDDLPDLHVWNLRGHATDANTFIADVT